MKAATRRQHYEFDVFVSYSSKDKAWVRGELLKRIEQAGLKAFIDFRDFTRGAPSIKEIERGVVKCRKTLVVLTQDYIQSGWTEIENIMVQTLDPANRELRLIPLLKTECQKPLRIGALTHVDFTDGSDQNLAWRQLLTALGKPLEPKPAHEPKRDDWLLAHPYPMPANFTGRIHERSLLTDWLNSDPIHPLLVLRALGGFGKSALSWHWLMHDVSPMTWPRVVWWSFYEADASFDSFLRDTLYYLNGQDTAKLGPRQQLAELLHLLHEPGRLLILDGFERALRAFSGLEVAYHGDDTDHPNDRDCLSPLAEQFLRDISLLPGIHAKVLITTRLCPRSLEVHGGTLLHGCREEELIHLQPADAVEFFRVQGIRGTDTEIKAACAPYGYHPLSLRLLTGLIIRDFKQPGDIASARRLDVSGDLVQRQHHVLGAAYHNLTPARRALLGQIACFRSSVSYDALKALASEARLHLRSGKRGQGDEPLDADLHDLVMRGLLHHDRQEKRFDLHPIVRRYAYDQLTAPNRATAHNRLRTYFAAVPEPEKVTRLEDLAPVIELYHHTVRAGQFDEASTLFNKSLLSPLYYQLSAHQLISDLLSALFPDGEDRLPRVKDERAQSWILNALANSYSVSGQPLRAVPLYEAAINLDDKHGDKRNLAVDLGNVADDQLKLGALRDAEANMRRRIALARDTEDEHSEAIGHQDLGRLLAYRGAYAESAKIHRRGIKLARKVCNQQIECVIVAYSALRSLLRRNARRALAESMRARKLADVPTSGFGKMPRDIVRTEWLLGAAHGIAGHPDDAERHLHEALEHCRRISIVDFEADILIHLAEVRAATGTGVEAQRLAEEALVITERSGYVLQGADAHLKLASLALASGDKAAAKEHAQKAKDFAACDGPPDYIYRAAYDKAVALLNALV